MKKSVKSVKTVKTVIKKNVKTVKTGLAGLAAAAVFALAAGQGSVMAATCETYSGDNTEDQNYGTWAGTVKSYLSQCTDGTLMRVQAGMYESIGGVLVEYYNAGYDVVKSLVIPEELPIFGAFYETDANYFLLTGQLNRDEDDSKEVYRITKYDKNWKRIASCGLSGCNTTVPFDAGSARMDDNGKYLVIRTSHEMYASSDGYNHQANVTIQVDMENMAITDKFTGVANSSQGYVSHSFNQFIKLEDGHIVSIDHGDAYPRSIVMLRYKTDISGGTFVSGSYSACTATTILQIPGSIGANATGTSAGGFEISDTAYLLAGNSVVQDESNLSRRTRNIYVAAVSKTTGSVSMNWLTSYEEGDGTVSTPHMVKIKNNQYMVLWSRNNQVYYVLVDGNGKTAGSIYKMDGNLSDCVPVVTGGKLIWYVWNMEKMDFYQINLSNLSDVKTVNIVNGHTYQAVSAVQDGKVTLECSRCKETKEQEVAASLSLWWNENGGSGSYYSYFNTARQAGDELYLWITLSNSKADRQMEITSSNPDIVSYSRVDDLNSIFTMRKKGTATITIRPKLNPSVSRSYNITVNPFRVESYLAGNSYTVEKEPLGQITVTNIMPEMKISDIFSSMTGTAGTLKVLSGTGDQITDTAQRMATGNKLQIVEDSQVVEESIAVVMGDVNGDGSVSVMDMESIQKDLLGITELEGIYRKASMLTKGDSEVSVLDMEVIQKHILGLAVIGK